MQRRGSVEGSRGNAGGRNRDREKENERKRDGEREREGGRDRERRDREREREGGVATCHVTMRYHNKYYVETQTRTYKSHFQGIMTLLRESPANEKRTG